MFRKINTKTLLALFAVLAIIVIIVLVYDHKKGERSFRSELFTIDSASVTAITIYPKEKMKPAIRLVKTGKSWEIKNSNKTYPADTSPVQNILQTLRHLKVERVSGTDRSSWKDLQITDSLSTHVVVEQNRDVVADFRLGKVSFTRNNNISIKSHIRVAGDDLVYVVNGYLGGMFSDQVAQYRNRIVLKVNKGLLTKLTFGYPADSSFVLVKNGARWFVNDLPADSVAVERYLNSITYMVNSDFSDDALPGVFTHKLRIEGNSMPVIDVKGVFDPQSKKYFVASSFNPSAVFGSGNANLFHQFFPSESGFEVKKVEEKKLTKRIKK